MKDIIGKWALVTGASSGLGAEFARILAEKGCHLVLVARRKELLQELERQIHGHYENQIEIIAMDLTEPNAAQKINDQLSAKKIHIDILINNAGCGLFGSFLNRDLAKLQNMIDLNIKSLTELAYIFSKKMAENNFGYILNIASNAAFQPTPYFAVYGATKSYVLNFSESLHIELKKKNVTVTCLCPPATATEFFQTAGSVPFALKLMMLKPEKVCKVGFEALMKDKMTVAPGVFTKILIFCERFFPRKWVANISALTMRTHA